MQTLKLPRAAEWILYPIILCIVQNSQYQKLIRYAMIAIQASLSHSPAIISIFRSLPVLR